MNAFREKLDRVGASLPLPNINPNKISGCSIIVSMFFVMLLRLEVLLSLAFLVIVLILDWMDGAIAKKYSRTSEGGYFVDVMSDRLSEGIIFSFFFFPWFFLFSLNCLLSLASVAIKKHFILPLRHIFLVLYAIMLFLGFPVL